MMDTLQAENLHKRYDRVQALDGASIVLRRGQAVLLGGPSGSGKTTLLRVLAGLEAPDSGAVRLDGRSPAEPLHRRGITMAFQSAALWPHMTVAENVAFGLHALPPAERRPRVLALLEPLGLGDHADRSPSTLSGGEARRVAVARALAPRPRWVLLDEPFAHLDGARTDDLIALLEAAVEEGAGLLIVSHAPLDVPWLATTLQMERGRVT